MTACAIAMAEVQEDSVLDRQLSAYTTMPVSGCRAVSGCRSGFDWTANQLIIEPAVRLVTKKED